MNKYVIYWKGCLAAVAVMLLAMSCDDSPEDWQSDPIPDPGPDITITNRLSFTDPAFTALYPPQQVAFYPATEKLINFRGGYDKSPLGTYRMGNGAEDGNHPVGENPLHLVALGGFKVSRNEVTVAQFRAFVAANPGKVTMPPEPFWGWEGEIVLPDGTVSDRSQFPIVNVTWKEAKAYADWVGGRLPTEAEFEFMQRNHYNDNKTYGSGNDITDNTWSYTTSWRYVKTVMIAGKEVERYGRTPGPVDSRKSTKIEHPRYTTIGTFVKYPADLASQRVTAYTNYVTLPDPDDPDATIRADISDGICDAAGNVLEWCSDWYSATYYQECYDGKTDDEYWTELPPKTILVPSADPKSPWTADNIALEGNIVYNPQGPKSGERKVIRGGGFLSNASQCRAHTRSSAYPGLRDLQIGFRVVWDRTAPGTGPASDVDNVDPVFEF